MRYLFLLFSILSFCFSNDFKRDSSKKVVIDNKHHLMWVDDKSVIKIKKDHENAVKYCKDLYYAGFHNWRIPEIEEYILIVDKKRKTKINKIFKYNLPVGYWSRKAHWRTFWFYADYMYFVSGTPYYDSRHKKKNIRCVRDMRF